MPRRTIVVSCVALVGAFILVLAACSPAAPSTPAQGSSSGGAVLNRIVQSKQLKVGVDALGYIARTMRQASEEFYPGYMKGMNKAGQERGWGPVTRAHSYSCGNIIRG